MKNKIFIVALVILVKVAFAQHKVVAKATVNELTVYHNSAHFTQRKSVAKATVNEVSVYHNSAHLKNTVSVRLPKGSSELIIANISPSIIEKSLRILINSSKVKVLSSRFEKNFDYELNEFTTTNSLKRKQDSISRLKKRILNQKLIRKTNLKAIELLDKNQTLLQGNANASISKLSEFLSFYQKKRIELLRKDRAFDLKIKGLEKRLIKIKEQFFNVDSKSKNTVKTGFLVVKLESEVANNFNLKINYLVRDASWSPFYEIAGKSLKAPLNFNFKAVVNQNTGVNWNNVKLNLIQGVSSRSMYAPVAQSWFLNTDNPVKNKMSRRLATRSSSQESEDMEESVAYQSSNIAVSVNKNQLNTSYTVPMKFTVKADNTDHLVNLSAEKIPADYTYYSLPKYQQQAFLIAKIKNFSKYNLVNAKAQVVFEDMYIGDTHINPSLTDNKMKITLGNDPKISIKKVKIKDKSGCKFLSNKKVKTITYDLVIRNNKNVAVKLELKDIYPISTNDAVEIELLEVSRASKDKTKGFLTWKLALKPNQLKTIRVSYKVRCPKDINISNL